jgi:hypothetical protein
MDYMNRLLTAYQTNDKARQHRTDGTLSEGYKSMVD